MAFSFGTTTTQPAASGSFSFGNTTQQNNQPAATGGSLFGSTNNASTNQPAGGSLFGSKPAAPLGGSLFGAPQASTQPSTSLFGQTPAQQNQPQPSTGLFGSTLGTNNVQGQNQTGSLFGIQSQSQQQQPQQQQQQQQQSLQQSTLNSSTLGIFGPSSNQQRGSLFASVSGSAVPKKKTLQERLQKVAFGVIDPAQSELRVSPVEFSG
jgi:hypothetical protein